MRGATGRFLGREEGTPSNQIGVLAIEKQRKVSSTIQLPQLQIHFLNSQFHF